MNTHTHLATLGVAAALLAAPATAEFSAFSTPTDLDTRVLGVQPSETDQPADTRTWASAWSQVIQLNTKRIIGTLLLLR
jgi:hypothetical protein